MPRNYTPMMPLWWVEEQLELTDRYPTGLAWRTKNRFHEPGDPAGILHQNGKFFYVSLANVKFTAHRLVYYLRTGIDPGNADVLHLPDNPERDNRKELILKQRKPARIPKYKRNRNPKELQTTLVN